MELNGSSAVVSGGASGLGAAVAAALADQGARVVIADLQEELGRAAAEKIGATFVPVDVTREDDVIRAVDTAREQGPLRVTVNCAGIGGSARMVGRDGEYASAYPLERFTKIITVNLIGTFNLMRVAATAMGSNEPDADGCRGVIVNTASVAAFEGQVGQCAYAASKGGIVALTLPAARDLAAIGVRVSTVAPGLIDTPIYDKAADPAAFKERLAQDVVFPPRLGTADEFAGLVLHIVGNSYLNGEVIRLDGGARLRSK